MGIATSSELRQIGRRLLAALRVCPDDHDLHLVYSDWLVEIGDPARAEFVRLMLDLARAEIGVVVPRAPENLSPGYPPTTVRSDGNWPVYNRAFTLLATHWRRWLPAGHAGGRVMPMTNWWRGVLVSGAWPLARWLQDGPAVVRSNPVRYVSIRNRRPLHCAWLTWLGDPLRRPTLIANDHPRKGYDLPPAVFWHLTGGTFCRLENAWAFCLYGSEHAANSALSRACLNFALGTPMPPPPQFMALHLPSARADMPLVFQAVSVCTGTPQQLKYQVEVGDAGRPLGVDAFGLRRLLNPTGGPTVADEAAWQEALAYSSLATSAAAGVAS